MADNKRQLVVLGGGPGGYVAAFHAADLGLKVTLIDQEVSLGGVCLLRGCVPSKALLHAREAVEAAREAQDFGVAFGEPKIDVDALRSWKQGVIKRLTGGLATLAKKRKIEYIQARGSFLDSQTLQLEQVEGGEKPPEKITFEECILATGSSAFRPGPLKLDDERVMGSRQALELPDIPKKLLVVGGGYIGLELGQVYQGLGSRVTVVEMMDGLIPGTDRDLVKPLADKIVSTFEAVHLETEVRDLKAMKNGIKAFLKKGDEEWNQVFDRVLVSVGRRPNSQGLGLENTQVAVNDRGFVEVDGQLATSDPHIRAIGDVTGGLMLAHKASYEGKIAAQAAAGEKTSADAQAIPAVVFSDPEIAYAGVTETSAQSEGRAIEKASFPWAASGRALILGQSQGATKLLVEPETHRILGFGMVGKGAGEMIGEGVLAIEMAARAEDLAGIIHTHPTLSETIGEAAEKIFGKAIHGA